MDCLIGMDLGTTNMKCVAYDPSGKVLAQSSVPTPVILEGESQASYDPEKIWSAGSTLIRKTVRALPDGTRVVGVAAASLGESVVPIDKEGKHLFRALAWFDSRPKEISAGYVAGDTGPMIRRTTGAMPDHTFSAFKAMWLQRTHPNLFDQVHAWLPMADYIAYRLSGIKAVSLSLASRTMLMDLAHQVWSEDLFRQFGLRKDQWPELVPGGTRLGGVTKAAAQETGLPEGAAVAAGGHDHLCGALASGAIDPGVILDSIGTTEAVMAPLSQPLVDETLSQMGFNAGCHAARNHYYVITGITGSGGLFGWLRRMMLGHIPDDGEAFRLLEESAAMSPPGANGVRVWPSFAGANPRCSGSSEKGSISGLTVDTTPGDIARAALEGLSAEFKRILDILSSRTGLQVSEIRLTGGGSTNALWREIKSAMTGQTLVVPEITEAGCMGAAILAGIASGIYSSEQDALQQISIAKKRIDPQPAAQAAYAKYCGCAPKANY